MCHKKAVAVCQNNDFACIIWQPVEVAIYHISSNLGTEKILKVCLVSKMHKGVRSFQYEAFLLEALYNWTNIQVGGKSINKNNGYKMLVLQNFKKQNFLEIT